VKKKATKKEAGKNGKAGFGWLEKIQEQDAEKHKARHIITGEK
jgi:hypothetical protein